MKKGKIFMKKEKKFFPSSYGDMLWEESPIGRIGTIGTSGPIDTIVSGQSDIGSDGWERCRLVC